MPLDFSGGGLDSAGHMGFMLMLFALALPVFAFAQALGGQVKRTNPPTLSKPNGYTHVVEITGEVRTIYVAGQVALDAAGKVVGAGDMKAQAQQVFKNLEAALAAGGATFRDVVKMNTYITDITKVPAMREVRAQYLGDTSPASTLVQIGSLAAPDFMLEIEVIAVVPAQR